MEINYAYFSYNDQSATRNVSMTEGRETAPVVQATTSIYTNSDANGTH